MAVNLNSSPYYDDFDENKNYQRILFKPGVSVQSRELNQVQSILHNSISKTADGVYGDNARITDEISSYTISNRDKGQNILSVKVQGTGSNVASYVGKYLTGATTETTGIIKFAYSKDEENLGDPTTLVIQVERYSGPIEFASGETLRIYNNITDAYNKNNNIAATLTAEFDLNITGSATIPEYSDEFTLSSKSGDIQVGDQLVFPNSSYGKEFYVTKVVNNTIKLSDTIKTNVTSGITLLFKRRNTVRTSIVTVSSGRYYKKGYFIKIASQSIVPDKYTEYPTKSIILKYSEDIIDYTTDSTLLDPAFESSNYLAPGADRFKTSLTISSVDLDANNLPDTTDDFVEVVRFLEGREEFAENARNYLPVYLNNILTERTYDESGNYEIIPFRMVPRGSTADDTSAKFNINKGKAVVGGQFIETSGPTEISITKAKTFKSSEDIFVNANQDEYIIIDNPSFGYTDPTRVKLFDVLEAHSTRDRSAMSASTLVGHIIIKHMIYDSGEGNNKRYRLYPYWYYQSSATLGVRNIKSLISKNNVFSSLVNNTGTYTNPKFFANVNVTKGLEVVNGNELMLGFELGPRKRAIFPIDSKYIKNISNIRVYHSKKIESQTVTSSSVTITLSGTEYFVGNAGTLNVDTKRRNYQLLVRSTSSGSLAAGEPIDVDAITMSLDSNKQMLTIGLSSLLVTGSIDLYLIIYNSELGRKTKHLNINVPSEPISIMNSNLPYSIFKSDIFALKGIYSIGSNSFHRNYNQAITYSTNDFVIKDGAVYRAKTGSTGQPVTNTTYWENVPKELESAFTFDNGQRDSHYELAAITYNGNITNYNPGNVVVVVDHFTHSGSGVIDFSSYPTSVQNNIPLFRSEDGTLFNLRNCLDFRPKKNDTNVAANFWADNNSNTYLLPNPVLENAVQLDFEYYLPRIDRLYLQNRASTKDKKGFNFYIESGIPDVTPKPPADNSSKDKLLLATLVIPPFTRIASDISIFYNKSPRYTMQDISTLDKRLTNLEKRVKKQGLDIVALNNQIYDGGNTANLLFKTGILVDDFSSTSANDIKQPHSTCLVDPTTKELKPPFSVVRHSLFFDTQPDLNVEYDLVSFKYTEESLISVIEATKEVINGSTTVNNVDPNPGAAKTAGSGSLSSPTVFATDVGGSGQNGGGGKITTDELFGSFGSDKNIGNTNDFTNDLFKVGSGSQIASASAGSEIISTGIQDIVTEVAEENRSNFSAASASNTADSLTNDSALSMIAERSASEISGSGIKSTIIGMAENLATKVIP